MTVSIILTEVFPRAAESGAKAGAPMEYETKPVLVAWGDGSEAVPYKAHRAEKWMPSSPSPAKSSVRIPKAQGENYYSVMETLEEIQQKIRHEMHLR